MRVRALPNGVAAAADVHRWTRCRVLVAHFEHDRQSCCRECCLMRTDAGAGRLTASAYEYVRSAILCHDYPPGTVLTEGTLATQLGVSKTPVRHALRALHQEGLLELGPRRQMLVCKLPPGQ